MGLPRLLAGLNLKSQFHPRIFSQLQQEVGRGGCPRIELGASRSRPRPRRQTRYPERHTEQEL